MVALLQDKSWKGRAIKMDGGGIMVQELEVAGDKNSELLEKIFALLRSQTGNDFSLYRSGMVYRQIERRMDSCRIQDLCQYLRHLQDNPKEVETLFQALLIDVTSFFRDPEAFELLKNEIFPPILSRKSKQDTVRIWVPGCSSGEEVYSIAIILRECLDEARRDVQIRIFGKKAIDLARIGSYPAEIASHITPDRLKRFFTKADNTYRIARPVREGVIFAIQNVLQDPPFTRLDMISCRNLLIYLERKAQRGVLALFLLSLKLGGILFLGPAENINGFVKDFSVVDKKWKIFAKNPLAKVRPTELSGLIRPGAGASPAPAL